MHIFNTAACTLLAIAIALPAMAQDVEPEDMPARLSAERIVKPVAYVETIGEVEAAALESASSKYDEFGESVVKTALQYLGARYRAGMSGPYAFDCSGFTSFIYGKANVPILRSSGSQYTQGKAITRIADLKKGDLVFFGGSGRSKRVGHVGIVTEVSEDGTNFSFVHASRTGVKISDLNEAYYSRRYIGARRIVEE